MLILCVSFLFYYYCKSRHSESPTEQEQPSGIGTGVSVQGHYGRICITMSKKYKSFLLKKSMKYHLIPSKHYRRASLFFSFTSKFVNQMVYWSLRTNKRKLKVWTTFWVKALEQPQSIVEKYVQTEPFLLKFIYSEKARNLGKSPLYFCPMQCQSKVRWRFHKILWPSQNL